MGRRKRTMITPHTSQARRVSITWLICFAILASSVDLMMDFTDPIIRGVSLFHCHLLSHEDKGMMAKIVFK
jgi:FtsP/CotA-like multicopper oxidase with cupredoxin domain